MLGPREPVYFCLECLDNLDGWRLFWCVGFDVELVPPRDGRLSVAPCGRRKRHPAHTFVERCACYGNNPEVKKRNEKIEQAKK